MQHATDTIALTLLSGHILGFTGEYCEIGEFVLIGISFYYKSFNFLLLGMMINYRNRIPHSIFQRHFPPAVHWVR